MLRPVPMTRALIVGPRDNLEATVENLYNLKLVHIVDHREGEEGLEIGRPLPTASEASEILVKLRSIASVLQVEETKPTPTKEVAGDLREKILSLELNISEEDAAKKKTQALLQDLSRKIDEVAPVAEAPLRFAVTDHTFIVEGWVPTESFKQLERGLQRFPGLFATELEQNHRLEHVEPGPSETDPPVLLRNAKPLRPFEMLVRLFST